MILLIRLVSAIFSILNLLIIARVIISWVRPSFDDPRWRTVLEFIYKFTEPILGPIRRILPTGNIGLDFSPIIAFIVLNIIRNFIIQILASLAF